MVEGRKEEEVNRVNHNHNNNKANNSNNKHFPGQVRGFLQCQNLLLFFLLLIIPQNQERHPASRETRRLLKQRSQESVRSGDRSGERNGERRSNTGSILGEEAGRRSVLGEDGGRRSALGGDEGRRSRLSEESKRSLVGGDLGGRREVGDGAGRQDIHSPSGKKIVVLEDGKRVAAAPIPELERSRGRGGERRMEVNQGQAAHQRRLDVKQDAKEGKIPKSTFERKAEERASTYLHWEDTPSLPSPPATPPAEGEFFLEPLLGATQNPPHMGHQFCRG